jgi:hypothetical protein
MSDTKEEIVELAEVDAPEEEEEEEDTRPVYLVEFFKKLLLNDKFADVYFIVGEGKEQKRFPAHRLVLAASSPLFEAMLYPPTFIENPPPVTLPLEVVITDPVISPTSFQSLLTVLYTDEVEVSAENISELIACAKKYQIEKLQIICAEFMEADLNAENVLDLFAVAPELLGDDEFGLEFIRENAEEIFASDGFDALSRPRLSFLLRDDQLCIEEQSVFTAVQRWGRAQLENEGEDASNVESLKKVIADLMPLVRFPTMDVADIASTVAPSGLLDKKQLLELFKYVSMPEGKDRVSIELPFLSQPRQGGFSITGESKLLESKYKKDVLKMFGDVKGLKFTLLYRGTRDGMDAKSFHAKCDGKGATFTIIRAETTGNVFGGYHAGSWGGSGWKTDKSWLYSLKNKTGKVLKYNTSSTTNCAYSNSSQGPTWGSGNDLKIVNKMTSKNNTCNPAVYKSADSKFASETINNQTLAGANKFAVNEIEVFMVVTKKK